MVGGGGAYQRKAIMLLITQHIFRAFFMMYYPFMNQTPIFKCKGPNDTLVDCTETTGGCVDRVIADYSPSSIVNSLGFYCDQAYVRTLASTLFFVGGNIGAAYYSSLSDSKGRKVALRTCYMLGSISLVLLGTIAVGPLTYMLCIMLVWGNFGSFCTLSITYASEISDEKFGKNASLIILLGIVAAEILLIVLALFIDNWRVLFMICIMIPCCCCCLLFKFLDESPVYLFGKGEMAQTAEVLKKMGDANGAHVDTLEASPPSPQMKPSAKMSVVPNTEPPKQWNYGSIIMHPKLRLRVLVFSILKFYLNMAFFGCIFALSSLGGSIHVNSFIACFAEGLGYILALKAYLFSTKALLKNTLQIVVASGISFLLVPTLSCGDAFFLCSPTFIQAFLVLIMRTALCFICGFMFNVGNDLFPAEVRCQSIGISEIAACIGGMVAPYVIVVAEMNSLNPLFLFGSLGFFALSASKYLPETQLKSLDENVKEDVEMSYVKMTDGPKRSVKASIGV